MKKLTVKKDIDCQACLSCSIACSKVYFKTEDPDLSFVQIRMKGDRPTPFTCIQCGKCARNCPQEAITQNAKGVYMIDKKKCVACGKCVEVCPFHLVVLPEGAASAAKCVACGLCAKACPMEMLEVVES